MRLPQAARFQNDIQKSIVFSRLLAQGQSVWLDYLQRGMTRSGELAELITEGLRGMTSNPSIFLNAIERSTDYDEELAKSADSNASNQQVFESLAVRDVQEAADAFRSVYDATGGSDGFVSIEVAPRLARDTQGSIDEARRLWLAVDRPNVMVKIPGTIEGVPAIEKCLREGININITLLFSLDHYVAVALAYMRALEARLEQGLPVNNVKSVASLFVSRVDAEVDKRISAGENRLAWLGGRVAVANAQLVYAAFIEMMSSERWLALQERGARVQRPLWASTGTKNSAYSDVLYVESLIGPDTITTVPPETFDLFVDHGAVRRSLPGDTEAAHRIMAALEAGGISMDDVVRVLENEGIHKFTKSMDALLELIGEKRTRLRN